MPKFSVIIPLYNKGVHIQDTLESVFNQQFTDFEIIIVNDGSTDDGYKKIHALNHPKIHCYTTVNKGVAAARNLAMQHAEGAFFAFLDADDFWTPTHLYDLNELIQQHPNCGLYASNYYFDYGNNFIVHPKFPTLPKSSNWSGVVLDFFLASIHNRIAWTSALAIPKETLSSVGNFNTRFTTGQDTDFWLRIAIQKPVAFTKKVSAIYNTTAINRLTNLNPKKRKFMTFEAFLEAEKTNSSLKKLNDIHRAELAIKHYIINDIKTGDFYKKNLNYNNINWKKHLLLLLPKQILKPLWLFKQWLKSKKIDFYT